MNELAELLGNHIDNTSEQAKALEARLHSIQERLAGIQNDERK